MRMMKKHIFKWTLFLASLLIFLKCLSLYFSNDDKYILFNAIDISHKESCPIPIEVRGKQYLNKKEPLLSNLKCPNLPVFAKVQNGKLIIDAEYSNCSYICINFDTDMTVKMSTWQVLTSTNIPCNYFEIKCKNSQNQYMKMMILTNKKNQTLIDELKETAKTSSLHDVMIIGLDSMSYQALKYYLPKTFSVFHKDLKGVSFEKFNTLGDGTTVNLQGMLTGTKDTETYETRRRIQGSKHVDDYDWIWKKYKRKGYVTAYIEDFTNYGTFQYRLNGFSRQPTDIYARTGFIYAEKHFIKQFCLGGQSYEEVQLDMLREFNRNYKDVPKFSFSFFGYLSHDDNKYASYLDDYLADFLIEQRQLYPQQIIILYSDHGHRFNSRYTMEGKYEERLPFMGISLPKEMSDEYKYLSNNQYTLVTGLDLHETLKDFIGEYKPAKTRQKSLIRFIEDRRTCDDIESPAHWCSCLNWKLISNPESDPLILKAAKLASEQISKFTDHARDLCAPLSFRRIHQGYIMVANEAVLKFKQSSDVDGFHPDLSDQMQQKKYPIRLVIETQPGNAQFDLTTTLITEGATQKIDLINYRDVSRSNAYAPWVKCLSNYKGNSIKTSSNTAKSHQRQISDIRKFCICKSALST